MSALRRELRLAWRNVWRSPRRSGLTLAAAAFAVLLVVAFVAMAAGQHEQMIEDAVRLASGHVALSAPGYRENRTLEYGLVLDDSLRRGLDATPEVRGWAPRISTFALLSKDVAAKGVALLGVDPAREGRVSTLAARVSEGRFVSDAVPRGIVLGRDLAHRLGAGVGDELLLYTVAYSLESAYELYRVVGLVDLPDVALERRLAIITLADAQSLLVYGNRVSEVAVLARDADAAPALAAALRARFGDRVEVRTWSQLMPELAQLILLDDAGMYLMLAILVAVVGFGILNTLLMSVLERRREFGVLLALGLSPASLWRMVCLESLLLAGVGLGVGLAAALPLVLWFQGHPIPLGGQMAAAAQLFGVEPRLIWKLKPTNPLGSSLAILAVAVAAALYPALRASRSRPVDALRGL